MKISPATLRRLEKLEAATPTGAGNWVVALNGEIIWDPWVPPALDNGVTERILAQLDRTRERLQAQPGYVPPTPAQIEGAKRGLDEALARMREEWDAVRAFTAKVERERTRRTREAS